MNRGLFPALMALGGACLFCMSPVAARLTGDTPALGNPAAVINLATGEGVRLVNGEWRYSGARIVEVDHRAPGPDLALGSSHPHP